MLSTGGTIASRRDEHGVAVASDPVGALLERAPLPAGVEAEGRDVGLRGSYLLTPADMAGVVRQVHLALADPEVHGVVVTHGTDTMEETSYLADLTHADPRPVVFTGAQRPADAPDADGPRNLADAVAVAAHPGARDQGALIVFAGQVFAAAGTRKTHTVALDAFGAPESGALGWVREGRVALVARPVRNPALPAAALDVAATKVDMVAHYPGANPAALDAAAEAGAEGIVLVGTGMGNATPEIAASVARLTGAGVVVALSTRVHAGPVVGVYGRGGGADLIAAGARPTGTLPASQAHILLTALLAAYRKPEKVAEELARRVGETSEERTD
ncbi:asparaginase [Pseudonocardia eucalypti]|uniref:Asparaginase n=1 Tax=Pseudonocardia eucalypti TaxID=648755 RepID=A0ABP9QSC3_9PSEU